MRLSRDKKENGLQWKLFFFLPVVFCLVLVDIVISKKKQAQPVMAVDAYFFESGKEEIDGYSEASIKSQVAIIRSDNAELSSPKSDTAELTTSEIREMVYLAITKNVRHETEIPELQYQIDDASNDQSAWVCLLPNLVFYPGIKYTVGDQTDPRVIWAVLDYVADSTSARRISLLAGGSYSRLTENQIFTDTVFSGSKWNDYFTDLPDTFSLQSMVDSAQARHPDKTIECINLNFNEIMDGGLPYNELPDSVRDSLQPEYYPVPADNPNGIGGLPTSNMLNEGAYNPTNSVLNCDILVNIPVLKTSGGVDINCVFKNYIGSVSRGAYASDASLAYPGNRTQPLYLLDHDKLVNTVMNLFSYHPSDYVLIDATVSLEGEGSHPLSARTGLVRRNFVIAGGDPVAAEAVAAASMNLNPHDIEMLRWGQAKGYGYFNLTNIFIRGDSLASVQSDVLAPIGRSSIYAGFKANHYYGRGCRRWLLNGIYSAPDISTEHIDEVNADPYEGDQDNGNIWTAYYSPEDYVDLSSSAGATTTDDVIYAFTRIWSYQTQGGLLYVGGVRDIKVWVNGEVALDTSGILTYHRVDFYEHIALDPGDNRILVKVRRSGANYGFSLAVVNNGGVSSRDIYYPHGHSRYDPLTGQPDTLSLWMKVSYFGGRTLPGTFYHLGPNDPDAEPYEVKKPVNVPGEIVLAQNRPNPFSARTGISFSLPAGTSDAELAVQDISGRTICSLFRGQRPGGDRTVFWDGTDNRGRKVPGGVYFYTLRAGAFVKSKRMLYSP
ncbi:DUF362 domain-containing protein [Fibrobacterota bacterium]